MRPISSYILLASTLAAVLAGIGCAHEQTPAATSAEQAPTVTIAPVLTSAPVVIVEGVNVGPNLREACDIDNLARAPKFDFDSSELSSSDRDLLAQVGRCLTEGPLRDKSLSLVGRADPRGEAEYNRVEIQPGRPLIV